MGVSVSQLSAPKPGYGTLGFQLNSCWLALTGLSPSLAGLSRPLQLRQRGGSWTLNLTSPAGFPTGFDLDSSLFARCYLGNPVLVSFPPPTKMLQFGGFPLPFWEHCEFPKEPAMGSPIGESPVLRLHAPTRGSFAACHALLRRSSRAILQTA